MQRGTKRIGDGREQLRQGGQAVASGKRRRALRPALRYGWRRKRGPVRKGWTKRPDRIAGRAFLAAVLPRRTGGASPGYGTARGQARVRPPLRLPSAAASHSRRRYSRSRCDCRRDGSEHESVFWPNSMGGCSENPNRRFSTRDPTPYWQLGPRDSPAAGAIPASAEATGPAGANRLQAAVHSHGLKVAVRRGYESLPVGPALFRVWG